MRTIEQQIESGVLPDQAARAVIERAGMLWSQLQSAYQLRIATAHMARCATLREELHDSPNDAEREHAINEHESAAEQYTTAVENFRYLCGSMKLEVRS